MYGINFEPELTGIGKYTSEMADFLAKNGHAVKVVTAPPYYPEWLIHKKYSGTRWTLEAWRGVCVYRCPLWVPARPGGLKRILHLATFAITSFPVMLRQIFWKPDVVWIVEPPLFCAPVAYCVAKMSGAKAWLHIQDYEVDAAFELGILKGGFLRSVVTSAERWLMRRFDVVSTISMRMMERAASKGIDVTKQVLLPNWVHVRFFAEATESGALEYRYQLNIPVTAKVALYSGNMGAKQGLEILSDVARLISSNTNKYGDDNIYFVFCGSGIGRAELVDRCKNLSNVRFMDLQPVEKLPDLLAMADIHLLPQRADAADLVMPSKLTGMLASARPVVATAQIGTELATVVQGCGLVVPPEQAATMAEAVMKLAANDELRAELGQAGRRHALQHMDSEAVLLAFEAKLLALCASK